MLQVENAFVNWFMENYQMLAGRFNKTFLAFKAGADWRRDQNAIDHANTFYRTAGMPADPLTSEEELGI